MALVHELRSAPTLDSVTQPQHFMSYVGANNSVPELYLELSTPLPTKASMCLSGGHDNPLEWPSAYSWVAAHDDIRSDHRSTWQDDQRLGLIYDFRECELTELSNE